MALDAELRLAPEGATRWDWWPLARLLTVLAVFAALAHLRLGWTLDIGSVATLPRQTFEVFSLFTLLSSGLAHLYLMLLCFPIYAIVTLNDWYYDVSRWLLTALGVRSLGLLAGLSLCGETALFGLSFGILRTIFRGL